MNSDETKTPNPDEVLMTDYIGIGFEGGVKTALDKIRRIYPQLGELELDPAELRTEWADDVANQTELISFNRHRDGVWQIGHGWAFRWLAYSFIHYMESIGAERFVKQEIEILSSLKSGQRWLVVEVYYRDWLSRHKRVQEGKLDALMGVVEAAANLLETNTHGIAKGPAEQLRLALNKALDWLEKESEL